MAWRDVRSGTAAKSDRFRAHGFGCAQCVDGDELDGAGGSAREVETILGLPTEMG